MQQIRVLNPNRPRVVKFFFTKERFRVWSCSEGLPLRRGPSTAAERRENCTPHMLRDSFSPRATEGPSKKFTAPPSEASFSGVFPHDWGSGAPSSSSLPFPSLPTRSPVRLPLPAPPCGLPEEPHSRFPQQPALGPGGPRHLQGRRSPPPVSSRGKARGRRAPGASARAPQWQRGGRAGCLPRLLACGWAVCLSARGGRAARPVYLSCGSSWHRMARRARRSLGWLAGRTGRLPAFFAARLPGSLGRS